MGTTPMVEPILLTAANPGPWTGAGNNTWLVDGAEPALIDAGIGKPEHVAAIAAALGDRPLVHVLVTHGHPDHASGVGALRERWPGLTAWKWPLEDGDGWRPLADGQIVRAGDRNLQAIHTPGHAPDHVCFWDPSSRDLYGGDMIIQGTTVMIPAGHGGDLGAYLRSLHRVGALNPRRVLPGHGAIIEKPAEIIADYVEHRRLRENQVRACLDEGLTDLDAIVARIYPNISDAVRPAARMTLEAHLQKLKDEEKRQRGE
jgi:glyoxylase-like metal-dependent hydrolase (beta-lactamase superfamily II)